MQIVYFLQTICMYGHVNKLKNWLQELICNRILTEMKAQSLEALCKWSIPH